MSLESEDYAELKRFIGDCQKVELAPTHDNYLSTAMAHQGIFEQLEETLIAITSSTEAEVRSPVFTRLCMRRFALTGKFNAVIAGEMALETGQDLETIVSAEGFRFQRTSGYFNRLPWDYLGKDGDYIDGIHYPLQRKRRKKNKNG